MTVEKPAYRADVQGLRAIAVIIVVLFHAGFGFSGGFVGVDAFFVLSGFVITRRLRWEVATTGTVDLRGFIRRRLVRLLPAVTLMTSVVLVASTFLSPISSHTVAFKTAMSATLFNANHFLAFGNDGPNNYFSADTELNPFLHMWSLSVEEQFYFVFPILILLGALFARKRNLPPQRTIVVLLSAIFVISFAASLVAVERSQPIAFYLAPFRAWEFLAGALLVWIERVQLSRRVALGMSATGAALLLERAWNLTESENFPGLLAVIPVAGTALMILGGNQPHFLSAAASHALPGYFGRTSYAWYLWHWPFIVFASATFPTSKTAIAAAVVLAFVVAALSTAALEEPVRNRSWTNKASVYLACACFAVVAGAFVGAERTLTTIEDLPAMEEFTLAFRPPGPAQSECGSIIEPEPACTTTVEDPDGTLLLLGDSTAWHLYPAAEEAAAAIGFDMTLTHRFGCPAKDLELQLNGEPFLECPVFWNGLIEQLEAEPPDVAVIGVAIDRYLTSDGNILRKPDGSYTRDPNERAAILRPALIETMHEITRHVDNVILVGITPKFDQWEPSDCSFATWRLTPEACGTSRDWDQIDKDRALALDIQDELARIPGVRLLDIDDELCDENGCGTSRDGEWIYLDYGHITADFSRTLSPLLLEAIEQR